jgi:AcrR family transcriptional regulator
MVEKRPLTRREQNKADAYRTIHQAAYRLVVVEECNAPVEEIATAAGVSPRTFFNYFRSKEEAIVGIRQPIITADLNALLEQASENNLLDLAVTLYFRVIRETVIEPERFKDRVAPFRERAEHRLFMHRHMADCEAVVNDAIQGLLDSRQMTVAGLDSTEASARAVTVLAGSVVRYTYSTHPEALYDPGDLRSREAIEVFRRVMKETL